MIDLKGDQVILEVYGIEKITNDIQGIESTFIASMFNNVLQKDINRPEGKVDVLIGYQYAAYHPQKEQNNGHLLLLENRFGKCVGGSHPMIKENNTTIERNCRRKKSIWLIQSPLMIFIRLKILVLNANPNAADVNVANAPLEAKITLCEKKGNFI